MVFIFYLVVAVAVAVGGGQCQCWSSVLINRVAGGGSSGRAYCIIVLNGSEYDEEAPCDMM